jgi:L-lysine exporter family protein LysE/ArgO
MENQNNQFYCESRPEYKALARRIRPRQGGFAMLMPFFQGFGVGGGLIAAIGAQNAFVLTQSVRRNHAWAVALLCSLCDALLIGAGVVGMGAAVAANPLLGRVAAWGGAAFLFCYGLGALRSALRGGRLDAGGRGPTGLGPTLAATLAVTLLNPHVYLDTVVMLGSLSGQFPGPGRYAFGAGAACASLSWFLALGLGGRLLAPVFARPGAWRTLDALVCATMWTIGAALLRNTLA